MSGAYHSSRAQSTTGRTINNRVPLFFVAQSLLDSQLQELIQRQIIPKGCTELDLSENLITQRGASAIANLLEFDDVSESK